jgi:hypothetical protein
MDSRFENGESLFGNWKWGMGNGLNEINSTRPVPVWYIWRAKPTKESLTHAN